MKMDLRDLKEWLDGCLRRAAEVAEDDRLGRIWSGPKEATQFPLPPDPAERASFLNAAAQQDRRICLLAPIDAGAPYPNFTAMTSLVTRFEDVVLQPGGRLDSSDDLNDGAKWGSIMVRASSGFALELFRRADLLDPEQFSAEKYDSERARLRFDVRFRQLVEWLALREQSRTDLSPLFVLPVERPSARTERTDAILEALEYLSCPRLCVALLGDASTWNERKQG